MAGTLYVVATPIGNLEDFSARAIVTLQSVDLIAAEDTRHASQLTHHFNIKTPVVAFHDHNEMHRAQNIVQDLQAGKHIALISDAGTPLVSDPGYRLVKLAQENSIKVSPVPGACAAIAALSCAGMASDRFCFEGFLPAKSSGRLERLNAVARETRTLIYYEAPHRIVDSLQDMLMVFGAHREITFAREITKTFETIKKMILGDAIAWVSQDHNQQKGEMVIVVSGYTGGAQASYTHIDHALTQMMAFMPIKLAAQTVADLTGMKKNELYERALDLKNQQNNQKD